jgi:hypothetical protein
MVTSPNKRTIKTREDGTGIWQAWKNNIRRRGSGWDNSVGIATRYRLDGVGIESRWVARFSATVQTGTGAQPASYKMGTVFFRGKAAEAWRRG